MSRTHGSETLGTLLLKLGWDERGTSGLGLEAAGDGWFDVAVTAFVTSTKLRYVEPG